MGTVPRRHGEGMGTVPISSERCDRHQRKTTMSQRVLLTGGRGFFGRRLSYALDAHGFEVATPARPAFDLMRPRSVQRAVREIKPDIIVHSAAHYGGLGIILAEPARIFYRNVLMTAHLFEAAARAGVQRILSVGSACSYPGTLAGDMIEEDFWSGPLHPSVEAYGFTKKVQEVGLHAYQKQYGIQGQMPIITNLYGEHDV